MAQRYDQKIITIDENHKKAKQTCHLVALLSYAAIAAP